MTNLYFPLPPARHLLSVITCSVWLEVTPPPVITIPVSLFLQRSINSQLVSIGYWSNLISTRTSLSSIEHVVGDGVVDGNSLGLFDGRTLGVKDGFILGFIDGNSLGFDDGRTLGVKDGFILGFIDGNSLGLVVASVGKGVVASVGNGVVVASVGRGVVASVGKGV